MKYLFFLFFFVLFSNCSLNKSSKYWTENNFDGQKNNNSNQIKEEKIYQLSDIQKKADDIKNMTIEEYEVYLKFYTKKNKFPDINK